MIPRLNRFKIAQLGFALLIAASQAGCSGGGGGLGGNVSTSFHQTNLTADQASVAANLDPALVNAWGIADSPSGPFWINDNGTGFTTVYNSAGVKQPLTVTIPTPPGAVGTSAPTGMVYNATPNFKVGGSPSTFLFATEDGTISGWNGGPSATLVIDNSSTSAIYKGIALGQFGGNNFLYATNFQTGMVEMYDANFAFVKSFTDSTLPGYVPFNVAVFNNKLYVTFASKTAGADDENHGAGLGYVDTFNLDGTNPHRLVSQGRLNAPWGMVIAPDSFGAFGNDLLVGNFGDGTINAYDASSGAYKGTVSTSSGNALVVDGLWGLIFGNGGQGGATGTLYFTAGPSDELHGLFGAITHN